MCKSNSRLVGASMIRRNPWQSLWATLWVVVVAARAQAPSSVYLEDLTSPELRAQVQAGKTVVLIPIGGTEQNGPAMTLGKHNERARVLAGKIARELGNALVAPVIAYVPEGTIEPPSGHMRFAGTISIPDDAFERTLESAARSLRVHGFRHVVLLGDHGGYQRDLHQAAENINHQWAGSGAHVQALTEYYRAATEGFAVLLRERGFRDGEIGTHAALADTSLMLAIDPGAVRTEVLKGREPLGPEQGVLGGDPHRASAQLGELGVDLIVSRSVTAIRAEVARDH